MISSTDLQIRENLDRQRASFRLKQLSGFRNPQIIKLLEVPFNWEKFPNSNNDFWRQCEKNKNKTSCIYDMDINSKFATHLHPEKIKLEKITFLTDNCKIELVTEEKILIKTFKKGEVIELPANELHALNNLNNFRVKFRIDWFPEMENWVGIFPTLKEN